MKNFIVRTITAVFFVAAIVSCFLRAEAMIHRTHYLGIHRLGERP